MPGALKSSAPSLGPFKVEEWLNVLFRGRKSSPQRLGEEYTHAIRRFSLSMSSLNRMAPWKQFN